jgi:hypothetical protein
MEWAKRLSGLALGQLKYIVFPVMARVSTRNILMKSFVPIVGVAMAATMVMVHRLASNNAVSAISTFIVSQIFR